MDPKKLETAAKPARDQLAKALGLKPESVRINIRPAYNDDGSIRQCQVELEAYVFPPPPKAAKTPKKKGKGA